MYTNFRCVQLSSISWSSINFVCINTCKCMYIVKYYNIIIITWSRLWSCGVPHQQWFHYYVYTCDVYINKICVTGLLKASFALPYATKLALRSCIVILDVGDFNINFVFLLYRISLVQPNMVKLVKNSPLQMLNGELYDSHGKLYVITYITIFAFT